MKNGGMDDKTDEWTDGASYLPTSREPSGPKQSFSSSGIKVNMSTGN